MKITNKWGYVLTIILITLAIVIFCSVNAYAMEYDETASVWTERMNSLHKAADILREHGYSEDSEVIQALKRAWEDEYHDLQIVAKVIEGEAGNCGYDQMVYTGVTVVSRKNSERFPNTIYAVVAAPNQYSQLYLTNFHTLNHKCLSAARDAIDGNHDAPSDLYWEALSPNPMAKEVWKVVEFRSDWYHSTTYFCRGSIYD